MTSWLVSKRAPRIVQTSSIQECAERILGNKRCSSPNALLICEGAAILTALENDTQLFSKYLHSFLPRCISNTLAQYYFGDVNLPRDKFLKEKITEDDGWVSVECLTTFNRLKTLSTDLAEITSALKKSTNDILEINDTDFKIRRSPSKPIPDADDALLKKASRAKTLYMVCRKTLLMYRKSGFPETYSMDDVQDFFTLKLNTNTVFLKLKRDDDKKFKGSIFVELPTQEQADKLIDDKELKCEDNLLKTMTRDNYFKEKDAEKKDHRNKEDRVDREPEENRKCMKKPGAVLHFKGVGEGASREDLKTLFGEHHPVAWVDFNRGETEGFVRFQEEGGAQQAIDAVKAANEDKIMIQEVETEVRVLEGEEEDNYWVTLEEDMQKARNRKQSRGGGRGGRGGGRGRGGRRNRGDKHFKRKRQWEDDANSTKPDGETDEKKPKADHKRFSDTENDNNGIQQKENTHTEDTAKKIKHEEPSPAKKAKVEE